MTKCLCKWKQAVGRLCKKVLNPACPVCNPTKPKLISACPTCGQQMPENAIIRVTNDGSRF